MLHVTFEFLRFPQLSPPHSRRLHTTFWGLARWRLPTHFQREPTARENSKICPREVMPTLRQTLVIRCGCLPIHFPINGIIPVESHYTNWSVGKRQGDRHHSFTTFLVTSPASVDIFTK